LLPIAHRLSGSELPSEPTEGTLGGRRQAWPELSRERGRYHDYHDSRDIAPGGKQVQKGEGESSASKRSAMARGMSSSTGRPTPQDVSGNHLKAESTLRHLLRLPCRPRRF
jgi:hypothetical protein